jgi:hypothetical protein
MSGIIEKNSNGEMDPLVHCVPRTNKHRTATKSKQFYFSSCPTTLNLVFMAPTTRASNKDSHPGHVLLPANVRQPAKTKKTTDGVSKTARAAAKTKAVSVVAEIEHEMALEDLLEKENGARRPLSPPKKIPRTASKPGSTQAAAGRTQATGKHKSVIDGKNSDTDLE